MEMCLISLKSMARSEMAPYSLHCALLLTGAIYYYRVLYHERQTASSLSSSLSISTLNWVMMFYYASGSPASTACDYKLLIHYSIVCLYSCISECEPRILIGLSHWSCCWFQRTCLPPDQLSRKRDIIVTSYKNMFSNVRVFVCEC